MSRDESPQSFRELLSKESSPYTGLSESVLEKLEAHYELLLKWNRRINLTRITKLEDAVRFHYCESLFLARWLPSGPLRILDVGSGAGFPGVPIAAFRSDCSVDLAESDQRKAVFLGEATGGFLNTQVRAERIETIHDAYDWVVSRAVAPAKVLKLKCASNFALLIGAEDVPGVEGKTVKLPWGSDRRLFHVERST